MALKHTATAVGVHAFGTRWKISFSLGQYTTVFQTEVYVIKACVVEKPDRNYRNRNTHILSDSQAANKALRNYRITSKLVWDCHQCLMLLSNITRVLAAMKWQISWPNWHLNNRSQGQNQLVASPLELSRKRSGTGKMRPPEALGILKWTYTGKGTHTGTHCQ
jgi:hypothetical protein